MRETTSALFDSLRDSKYMLTATPASIWRSKVDLSNLVLILSWHLVCIFNQIYRVLNNFSQSYFNYIF